MPIIPSSLPYFPSGEIDWILDQVRVALTTGDLTRGPHVSELERQFAEMVGTCHAVAVSSGTAALEIALRHFRLNGGEVIVPTNTFFACANAVLFANGVPVFADIDAHSLCVNRDAIRRNRNERTRGVMVVHIAGMVCPDIEQICEYCKHEGLFLIEDAAHAHGALHRGRKAGAWGDVGTFSFFPTKPMTTAEGGMITTNDETLARSAQEYRSHGVPADKNVHTSVGNNYRLDELSAILGLSQLRTLQASLQRRRAIARRYDRAFSGLQGLQIVAPASGDTHSYYKYPVIFPTRDCRDALSERLRTNHGIQTGTVYYPPCHLQPIAQARTDLYVVRTPLTVADEVLPRVLCLPMHANLDEPTIETIIDAVFSEYRLGACA